MRRGISSHGLLAVEWSLIATAIILLIARLNLRLNHLGKGLLLSDCFILASLACAISIGSIDIVLSHKGVYQPWIDFSLYLWKAPDAEMIYVYKLFYFLYFPFYLEQYFNKGALLALYFEIFGPQSRKLRIILYCLATACFAAFLTTLFIILFLCHIPCYWSLTAPCQEYCWTVNDNLGWAFHFVTDLAIFLFPLIYISRTNMTRIQKISASVTFAIGFINLSVMTARWFVVQAVFTLTPALTTGQVLAVADAHTGLIVTILPSLRPYLRIWQGADLSSRPTEIISGPTELVSKSRRTFSMSQRTASTVRTECYAVRSSKEQSKDSSY